jgi:hypothetical protein
MKGKREGGKGILHLIFVSSSSHEGVVWVVVVLGRKEPTPRGGCMGLVGFD